MTAPAVAPSAEVEEPQYAAEASDRLDRFTDTLHAACTAKGVRPNAPWPWGTRMQEQYNQRQDVIAEGLLDQAQADLEAIEDVAERCLTAEALIKEIDARCVRARYDRDIGLIVMLFRHYDGWRQYLLAKRKIDDALNQGEIDAAEHRLRQSAIEDERRSKRSGARWRPTSAGALARISRGLINSQIKPKVPAALGQSLRADEHGPQVPTPSMERAEQMAERNGRVLRYCGVSVDKAGIGPDGEKTVIPAYRTLRNVAQAVRDASMDEILDGTPDGGLGWQNVVLARELGISTARVAQLRTYTP